jgi:hypothetical protein
MARRAERRWSDAEVPALLKRRRASMRRQQGASFRVANAQARSLKVVEQWDRFERPRRPKC